MSVTDPTTVDMVAKAPDGRVVLVMTEDRLYDGRNDPRMVEDLLEKVNGYVRVIRSGGLRESIGPDADRGVDIELSCRDEPPAKVRELLELAAAGLADEGVGISYRVLPPPSVETTYDAVGDELRQAAPEGWERIRMQATLVGTGLAGELTATDADGRTTPMPPPRWLPVAMTDLKRNFWKPERGTWLTFHLDLDRQNLTTWYDADEPQDGAAGFTPADWAEELRRYPRPDVPAWWTAQLP